MRWYHKLGWLAWPAKRNNNLNPWFIVLWRLLWLSPALVFAGLYVAVITMIYGPAEAKRRWKELT